MIFVQNEDGLDENDFLRRSYELFTCSKEKSNIKLSIKAYEQ